MHRRPLRPLQPLELLKSFLAAGMFLWTLVFGAPAPVASDTSQEPTTTVESPLEFLEPIVGLWLPHPDWLAKNPGMDALVPLDLQWQAGRRSMTIREGLRHAGVATTQGTLVWNPVTQQAEFLAQQTDDGLVFRGVYEPAGERTVRRVYDVLDPDGSVRVYRETFHLRTDGVLDWTTERQVDGTFQPVGPGKGPEFQAVRPSTEPNLPAWARQHMASQIGSWIADNGAYQSEQEPFDAYRMVWRWGLGEASLVGRLMSLKGGEEQGTLWEYRVFWHPGDRTLQVVQYGADGSMAEGVLESTGEHSAKLVQTLLSAAGQSMQVGHRDRLEGNVRQVESFTLTDAGAWVPRRAYQFRREP